MPNQDSRIPISKIMITTYNTYRVIELLRFLNLTILLQESSNQV